MPKIVSIQGNNCSNLDPHKLCSFDMETISKPTRPLIHQSARFWFIRGGRGTVRIQNEEHALAPGTVVAILPWQMSEIVEVTQPLQYYLLVYRFDTVNDIIKYHYNPDSRPIDIVRTVTGSPVVYCGAEQAAELETVFGRIRDEVGVESLLPESQEKTLHSVYITNLLVELLVLCLRAGAQNDPQFGGEKRKIDPSDILQYMYNHLSEKLTLKNLSRRFYMSESAISNYITQVTGLSFFDLLGEMRVGKTIHFLLYTDFTLDELAEIMGYVDASHISKVFAARIGMRVNEYRKTYQRVGEICNLRAGRTAYSVVETIYRNYAEPLTPLGVAGELGISVPELQKMLLYQVERNFEDFLNYVRVNRASELLLTTDKSVLSIALDVGYNSSKTLTRNFLKLRVMTPGDFRKKATLQQAESWQEPPPLL